MALQIINAGPPPEEITEQIRAAIGNTLPEATIDVRPQGPGHFEITVTDAAFEGLNRVKQQQLVYGAITDLMAGASPPVHAIDRLECLVPS
jgi:acid stress-induced BolA-like protein IbaG/YrbA